MRMSKDIPEEMGKHGFFIETICSLSFCPQAIIRILSSCFLLVHANRALQQKHVLKSNLKGQGKDQNNFKLVTDNRQCRIWIQKMWCFKNTPILTRIMTEKRRDEEK